MCPTLVEVIILDGPHDSITQEYSAAAAAESSIQERFSSGFGVEEGRSIKHFRLEMKAR